MRGIKKNSPILRTPERTQYGALVIFAPDVAKDEANAMMAHLIATFPGKIGWGSCDVNSFNPKHGGPVWYVP